MIKRISLSLCSFAAIAYILYHFCNLNSALLCFVYVVTCAGIVAIYNQSKEELKLENINIPTILLAALFSIATITGLYFGCGEPFEDFTLGTVFVYLFLIIFIFPLVYVLVFKLYAFVDSKSYPAMCNRSSRDVLVWLVVMLIIFAAWIPVWLAYYPGLWNYDPNQVKEWLYNHFSQFHPLIHTLFLSACYVIGTDEIGSNKGVIIYDVIQMLVMSSIFSYAFVYVKNHIKNKVFLVIMLLFFAFFPVNSILVISSTKDVIFSGLVLLNLILSLRLLEEKEKKRKILLIIIFPFTMTLMMLFRNNAKYAFLLVLLVAIILVIIKRIKARVVIYLAICMLMFVVGDKTLAFALDADSGRIQETMSIPSQQMGRIHSKLLVAAQDEESRKEIEYYYAPYASYNEKILVLNGKEDVIGFLKLSAKLFFKYPIISLDSYLYLTQGAWNIGDVSNAIVYGKGLDNRQGYLLTDVKEGYGITHSSKMPWLENILERAFSDNEYQNWPLISVLFAPALYVWIFLFVVFGLIKKKSVKYTLPVSFMLFLLLTILAGPCIVIRYVYPFVVTSFVFIAMLVGEDSKDLV